MSNALAIAAVTSCLRQLLDREMKKPGPAAPFPTDFEIRTRPPHVYDIPPIQEQTFLNLFLYQVLPNAAWSNREIPGRTKPGERGYPPLALNLHYLITAYVASDSLSHQDIIDHALLGRAMGVLNDHPVLLRGDVLALAGGNDLREVIGSSELADQIDTVKFSLLPLSLEDINKLWGVFNSRYRLSVAYEASVALIESQRKVVASLPVLRRGPSSDAAGNDRDGIDLSGMIGPTLDRAFFRRDPGPARDPAPDDPLTRLPGRYLDTLVLIGSGLGQPGSQVRLIFRHPEIRYLDKDGTPIDVPGVVPQPDPDVYRDFSLPKNVPADPPPGAYPVVAIEPASPNRIAFRIPDDPVAWPPGTYSAAAVVKRPGRPAVASNAVPFALSPRPGAIAALALAADLSLVGVAVTRHATQRASLLVGAEEFPVPTATAAAPPTSPPAPAETGLALLVGVAPGEDATYTVAPAAFDWEEETDTERDGWDLVYSPPCTMPRPTFLRSTASALGERLMFRRFTYTGPIDPDCGPVLIQLRIIKATGEVKAEKKRVALRFRSHLVEQVCFVATQRGAPASAVLLKETPADLPPGKYLVRVRVDGVDNFALVVDPVSGAVTGFDARAQIQLPVPLLTPSAALPEHLNSTGVSP
jgi:hypothetical protein